MKVTIDVKTELLPPHTQQEFEEWVKFQVGATGGMSGQNPLAEYDMEVSCCDFS